MSKDISKLDKFLNFYSNTGTKHCYRTYLKKFERGLNTNLDSWIKKSKEQIMDDIKTVLIKYEKIPPKSKQTMMNAVKSFLEDNYIETPNKFWKHIRLMTKGGPLTEDFIPTREQLKNILFKGTVKDKAFFLVLASSGMYHGEALSIEERDIHFEHTPTMIKIREEIAHKGGKRITFISKEAEYWLKKWLKQKPDYLIHADKVNNLGTGKVNIYDKRVFPFSNSVSRPSLIRLIKDDPELNIKDENTGRFKFHIHCFRKYFRTTLGPHMKQDIIETLMGHENQLQKAYRKYSIDTLSKEYLNYEKELTILQPKMSEEELLDRLNKFEEEQDGFIEKQKIWEEKLRYQEKLIDNYENRINKIENNLHVSLNPENPDTQDTINKVKPYLIKSAESLYGRKATKEELDEIKTGLTLVLNYLKDKPIEELSNLVNPENLPYLYDQIKKKTKK
jgi:integrase